MRRASLFRHIIIDLRFVTLVVIVSVTASICVYTRAASKETGGEAVAAMQGSRGRAQQPQRRRRPSAPVARPRTDYSKFSHATKGHFENCSSCHLIPSFQKPDIADYPDHPSCINCHRQQFFRGARPVICSNCHTVTTPRSEARFKFPKEGEASQFTDIFPHASHIKTTSLLQFEKVSGRKMNIQATCMHCHKVDALARKPPVNAPPDAAGQAPFRAGTFMTTPTSHATCFACHWQKGVENREQPPLSTECAGCHKNLAKPLLQTAALTQALTGTPARAASAPQIVPAVARGTLPTTLQRGLQGTLAAHTTLAPPRITPKFAHEFDPHKKRANENWKPGDDVKTRELTITCTQCHAGVRKATTLEAMQLKVNQVQLFPSCSTSACHTALSGTTGLKLSVFRELKERGKDAKFDCALCHVPPISLNPEVPCSHYKAVRDAAKKENEASEKAGKKPRSLAGIEGLIPPRCAEAPAKKEGS
ncbi:MAG TPA: cytochrome c3 family protein [Pyrinomonadaceae bacterium]|nr:cytochrome c3 family protein [Pyrinomonadaceae bacterium]